MKFWGDLLGPPLSTDKLTLPSINPDQSAFFKKNMYYYYFAKLFDEVFLSESSLKFRIIAHFIFNFQCMQSVMNQETNLASCQGHYGQLESSITQRLRWAVGANPSLNLVLQQFEDATTMRKHQAEVT